MLGDTMNTVDILIWVPLLAVLVAIISLIVQSRRSKFSLNVDLLLKLDDRFNSEQFKALRKAAAQSIKAGTFEDAEEIIDFFEMIGLLVRRRALDVELVWHSFFHWIHHYAFALEHYIALAREKDPTIWEDFVLLREKVVAIEKRKRKCSDTALQVNKTDLEQFVRNESRLK